MTHKPTTATVNMLQQDKAANTGNDFVAPICSEEIDILFQDQYILLINKPSGLLSLSGKNPLNKDSVHYRLTQEFPSARLAHRLDFGTSGIMVVALNKSVNAHLTKQFQQRTVKKTYTAILQGHVADDHGTLTFCKRHLKPAHICRRFIFLILFR